MSLSQGWPWIRNPTSKISVYYCNESNYIKYEDLLKPFSDQTFRFNPSSLFLFTYKEWLHRCWWRMLMTKFVSDNNKLLVTLTYNINAGHQHSKDPQSTHKSSIIWCHQHHCHRKSTCRNPICLGQILFKCRTLMKNLRLEKSGFVK